MKNSFYAVAIGASAGGLKALTSFFGHLHHQLPVAFIVIQHLNRDHKSQLANLIAAHTQMEVIRIVENIDLKPGKVFVMIEDSELEIKDNTLIINKRGDSKMNKAIDRFFVSLANSFKKRAIGIILSGGGNDGLQGALTIRKNGGHVLVQEPTTADASSMPNSIINYDHPITVLNPAALAQHIVSICNQDSLNHTDASHI